MTEKDLDLFADYLEEMFIGNVSGGKSISEAADDFIYKHPWLTFFTVNSAVSSISSAIRRR